MTVSLEPVTTIAHDEQCERDEIICAIDRLTVAAVRVGAVDARYLTGRWRDGLCGCAERQLRAVVLARLAAERQEPHGPTIEHETDECHACAILALRAHADSERTLQVRMVRLEEALRKLYDISYHVASEISLTPGDDPVADQHFADWRAALDVAEALLAEAGP